MKVLLTGGAGFIGSSMLWRLNQAGVRDIIVVDHLGSSDKWKNLVGKHFEDYFEKDKFLDYLESGNLNRKIDIVIVSQIEAGRRQLGPFNAFCSGRIMCLCL